MTSFTTKNKKMKTKQKIQLNFSIFGVSIIAFLLLFISVNVSFAKSKQDFKIKDITEIDGGQRDNYLELEREIINQLNQIRADKNLEPLEFDSVLKRAANLKLADMIENKYFSHISPAGVNAWHWFKKVGYDYKFAGENLATNFIDATDVTEAWMKSKSHRDNMLFPEYREIAIAIAKNKKGKLVAVELFGKDIDDAKLASTGAIAGAVDLNETQISSSKGKLKSPVYNLQTNIVPVKFISQPFYYDVNVNSAILLIIGMVCFILVVNVWVLEKEDEKILAQLT
jgi:uncharacterized protein YkwD